MFVKERGSHLGYRILVTLGPSSLAQDIVQKMENEYMHVFRINLSHTPIDSVEKTIAQLQGYTNVPICLDSEGAQIRNQSMAGGEAIFQKGDVVKISYDEIEGDSNNISFTPHYVANQLKTGDRIRIDFNSVCLQVVEKTNSHIIATVETGGLLGSNKAADVDREIELEPITSKDKEAIKIGKRMGVKHFALSFAGSRKDVEAMRELTGNNAKIISKIESRSGLSNLGDIIKSSDEILVDRGDLSRQVDLEKIPFLQRRIISMARSMRVPVYVATNLLESMINGPEPTRAEINDVVSTLIMGGNGLVLAAETAIGLHPVQSVKMIERLIVQLEKWTENSSIEEVLAS